MNLTENVNTAQFNDEDCKNKKKKLIPTLDIQKALDFVGSEYDSASKPINSSPNKNDIKLEMMELDNRDSNPLFMSNKDEDSDLINFSRVQEELNNANNDLNLNTNFDMEDLSDNEDAFALNDKDDLFLSELGNILLEEEKLTEQWADCQNDEDI